jgi:heme O synthase-like polyprenyltransferase
MGKLRQWFRNWFDRQIEQSMQRQANRLFLKGKKQKNAKD